MSRYTRLRDSVIKVPLVLLTTNFPQNVNKQSGKMAKIVKTLRNNWKKSIFFSGVAIYGANYGNRKWQEYQLMRQYCQEALAYGQAPIPMASAKPYHVTVILNPACHGGKGATRFEKYCAPILHLAGMKVMYFLWTK